MRRVALVAVSLVLASACGADFWYLETNNLSGGPTFLIIVWSDSPVDEAESVTVTLDRVELLGAGGETEVLLEQRRSHDLLRLQNGRTEELVRATVASGEYEGLRFVLAPDTEDLHTIRVGGAVHPLRFPGADGHVVDLPHALDLAAEAETRVHVDFNVRMSVFRAGDGWYLDPRLRAIDPATGGAIVGAVHGATGAPLGGATVSAQQSAREVLSTRTAPDGSFRLAPLGPGRYAVLATAPGHAHAAAPDVAVTPGADAPAGVLVLAAAVAGTLDGSAPRGRDGLAVRVLAPSGLLAVARVDPLTGLFEVPSLPPGVYTVELWDEEGLRDRQVGVRIEAHATTTLLF